MDRGHPATHTHTQAPKQKCRPTSTTPRTHHTPQPSHRPHRFGNSPGHSAHTWASRDYTQEQAQAATWDGCTEGRVAERKRGGKTTATSPLLCSCALPTAQPKRDRWGTARRRTRREPPRLSSQDKVCQRGEHSHAPAQGQAQATEDRNHTKAGGQGEPKTAPRPNDPTCYVHCPAQTQASDKRHHCTPAEGESAAMTKHGCARKRPEPCTCLPTRRAKE